jgi:hypothetical protein
LHHPRSADAAEVPFALADAKCGEAQVNTARGIMTAYQSTVSQVDSPLKAITDSDLWGGITRVHFAEMVGYLEAGQAEHRRGCTSS